MWVNGTATLGTLVVRIHSDGRTETVFHRDRGTGYGAFHPLVYGRSAPPPFKLRHLPKGLTSKHDTLRWLHRRERRRQTRRPQDAGRWR